MIAVIRAISGPLRGALFRLVQEEVTIGRQSSNLLCIGDLSVSRFHCVIQLEAGRYRVKDLQSHNGTYVNGEAVRERFLQTGDQLGVGDTVFEFREESFHAPDKLLPVSDQDTVARAPAENYQRREEVPLRHEMIGQSARMQAVYQRIARIAPTDATVLICGETGTGKELAARAIHQNSPRAGQPFEAINGALLKGDLLESELFGHERGAFTGAVHQKKGKLELAEGGTVFLDEVAELAAGPQAMLLRVLQERLFERLGGTKKIHINVRIMAATNRHLEEAIRSHQFREDLYYRLNVVSVQMPPLRERRDDISRLAEHFLHLSSKRNKRVVTGFSLGAMACLRVYDWPGNVRELENAVEHAVVFGGSEQVMPEDLPEPVLARTPQPAIPAINYQEAVRKAKQQIVREALEQAQGDHAKAAQLLQIHPNNLYRLLRDLEVKPHVRVPQSK